MVKQKRIHQIKAFGLKRDCVEYLTKRPELQRQGYKITKLGRTWVMGR